MQINVTCLPSDFNVNVLQSDNSLNCEQSDFNVNVSGLFNGTTRFDEVLFIVDHLGNNIVDELGKFLIAGVQQTSQEFGVIVANCLPSDWIVNTE